MHKRIGAINAEPEPRGVWAFTAGQARVLVADSQDIGIHPGSGSRARIL
jgi:hypothetical protein